MSPRSLFINVRDLQRSLFFSFHVFPLFLFHILSSPPIPLSTLFSPPIPLSTLSPPFPASLLYLGKGCMVIIQVRGFTLHLTKATGVRYLKFEFICVLVWPRVDNFLKKNFKFTEFFYNVHALTQKSKKNIFKNQMPRATKKLVRLTLESRLSTILITNFWSCLYFSWWGPGPNC